MLESPDMRCKNGVEGVCRCGKRFVGKRKTRKYCSAKCSSKRWEEENSERHKEVASNYYRRNKERIKERIKRWREENPKKWERIKKEDVAKTKEKAKEIATFSFLARMQKAKQEIERLQGKMKEKYNDDLEAWKKRCSKMTDQQLIKLLQGGMQIIKEQLIAMAAGLEEAELRGLHPEGERWFFNMLREISARKLNVDVVIRFAGRPHTFAAVKAKTPKQQEALLKKSDSQVEALVRQERSAKKKKATPKEAVERCLAIIRECAKPDDAARYLQAALTNFLIEMAKAG